MPRSGTGRPAAAAAEPLLAVHEASDAQHSADALHHAPTQPLSASKPTATNGAHPSCPPACRSDSDSKPITIHSADASHPPHEPTPTPASKPGSAHAAAVSHLFRFAGPADFVLLAIGLVASFAGGAAKPLQLVFFSHVADTIGGTQVSGFDIDSLRTTAYRQFVLGGGVWAAVWLSSALIDCVSATLLARFRVRFLRAALSHDVGWYDVSNGRELAGQAGEMLVHIDEGLSSRTWGSAEHLGMAIAGLGLALYYKWQVALVALALMPITVSAGAFLAHVTTSSAKLAQAAYAAAGGCATEAFAAIRTVAAYGLHEKLSAQYDRELVTAEAAGVSTSFSRAVATSLLAGTGMSAIGLCLLYGGLMLAAERDASAISLSADLRLPPPLARLFGHTAVQVEYCGVRGCDRYDLRNLYQLQLLTDFDAHAPLNSSLAGYLRECFDDATEEAPAGLPSHPHRPAYRGLEEQQAAFPSLSALYALVAPAPTPPPPPPPPPPSRPPAPAPDARCPSCASLGLPRFALTCDSASAVSKGPVYLRLLAGANSTEELHQLVEAQGGYFPCGWLAAGVVVALFALNTGAQGLGFVGLGVSRLSKAKRAAATMLDVIDRVSPIDPLSEDGLRLPSVRGEVELREVSFAYPSAPQHLVCRGYSLRVSAGQHAALCGPSGGGKSTAISLLERFYDPLQGAVLLDGVDVRTLNVKWLRQQIGLVAQEPVLFVGTVAQNIAYGKEGATEEEVVEAARMANAHTFVTESLSDGYHTQVGQGGSKLSGGQKQRVAIARALVRQPALLLLDEATSALDNESEKVVQAAIDQIMARQQRTTITVAHRLSTIRHADMIAVVSDGRVVEQGTYDELLAIGEGGLFHLLAGRQRAAELADLAAMAASADATSPVVSEPAELRQAIGGRGGTRSGEAKAEEVVAGPLGVSGSQRSVLWRLWQMHKRGDGFLFFFGSCGALVAGGANPTIGYLLTKVLNSLFLASSSYIRESVLLYACMLIGCALTFMVGACVEWACFNVAGEHLTRQLRSHAMRKLLRQEVGYFDFEQNNAGELAQLLSEKVTLIHAMCGENLQIIVRVMMMVGVGLSYMFIFGSWQLSLVMLGSLPLMTLANALAVSVNVKGSKLGATDQDADGQRTAGALMGEAILSIRTVAAFTAEATFLESYTQQARALRNQAYKAAVLGGFLQGFSQAMIFFVSGGMYLYGGWLVNSGALGSIDIALQHDPAGCASRSSQLFQRFFTPMTVVIMLAAGFGRIGSMATDASKASTAARELFARLERSSKLDPLSEDGLRLPSVRGEVELREVSFAYPSAPQHLVCRGYSLHVSAGQHAALCGPSGGGKSTAISLLERFYDPLQGAVLLDGVDVRTLNVKWLRQQIGLVAQEPVLFVGTVAQNIAYGKEGATEEEVVEAARMANAHTFVTESLSDGYHTQVGQGGSKLSGGQKQRVAIARALVRQPALLLLDEATSALDNESEKVVQAAIDQIMARQQRTTITVAHRLSTIRHADMIAVVSDGRVVEKGTHEALLVMHGVYASLVHAPQP